MPKRYQQRRIRRRAKRKNKQPPVYRMRPKEVKAAQGYYCNCGMSLEKWLKIVEAGGDPLLDS